MSSVKVSFFANELINTHSLPPSAPMGWELIESYELVTAARASGEQNIMLEVDAGNLLEMHFDDDTQWLCPPDALAELFPGDTVISRSGEQVIALPSGLHHPEGTRSVSGSINIRLLNIFTNKDGSITSAKFAKEGMKALARKLEITQLGKATGLMKLTAGFDLAELENPDPGAPLLIFIHGTNSSTYGSFAEIKGSPLWAYITTQYKENNILAFQHETLTKSPLQNAAELMTQLSDSPEVHIITHSRGGLVGEVLGRFSDGNAVGFSAEEVQMLQEENREDDLNQIERLKKLAVKKHFSLKKFIRVACPAAGTTILSKRLDYFFNFSLNLIGYMSGVKGNPVYQLTKDLLAAAVSQKNDVEGLPGMEAMRPDSPFINVINNQASPVSLHTSVVAIAGNCNAKMNLSALVIIASRLFYLEDNDLVVNTQSMYNGSRRLSSLQYFFDEGAEVDHFHYFKNESTKSAILMALKSEGGLIPGFEYFTREPLGTMDRNAILRLEGGRYSSKPESDTRPIAIVIPGIMGSTLERGDELFWINYLRFLGGGLKQLGMGKNVMKADYVIETSYKALAEDLKKEYDVLTFSYDWRMSLRETAGIFNNTIERLLTTKRTIKIIGHSMGGVLVRDFMVFHPGTWSRLNQMQDFQLLFLGAPLRGSFRINSVLFGEDDIINKLSKIDIMHSKRKLVELFIAFPGILSLLPFTTDPANDFSKRSVWQHMKNAFGDSKWAIPPQSVLDNFGAYRDAVLNAVVDFSNASYIAGRDDKNKTPCGYVIRDTARGKVLEFMETAEGDQSVTWDSGIPDEIRKAGKVYYVNNSHGALSCTPQLFEGIREILKKGSTTLLSRQRPMLRGAKEDIAASVTDFDYSLEGVTHTLLGITVPEKTIQIKSPLKVLVTYGDLKFSKYPILAGHFEGDGILNAERRIDGLLGGLLSRHHQSHIYPGAIGTHQIFIKKGNVFNGAIVLGLGDPGNLNGFELARSVERGVLKYLMDINDHPASAEAYSHLPLGISSLMIACGYGGLSFDTSIRSVLSGIENANRQIRTMFNDSYRICEYVEFVDYYDDNARNCMLALHKIGNEEGGRLKIVIADPVIQLARGGKKGQMKDTASDWWKRIVISNEQNKYGEAIGLRFSITTGAAREEFKVIYTATKVVEALLEEISKDNRWNEERAKAIFTLLIPNEMKDMLRRQGNVLLVLDQITAAFPWELLHDKNYSTQPLSINGGMVRQFLTENSRTNITMATGNDVLIVGDPELNNPAMQLPGAVNEARMVNEIFASNNVFRKQEPLINSSAAQIVQALFSGEYKVVHLAGHGVFSADPEKPSGMLIGENAILSAAHMAQLDKVPELVFLNCCYLGRTDAVTEDLVQSRFRLAANLGSQLINIGVKAIVVAGWAIDDQAALEFCRVFYSQMMNGRYFGDAIKAARVHVYNEGSTTNNTWGAYQVYGDPFYSFMDGKKIYGDVEYVLADQAHTDLYNLLSEIKMEERTVADALERLESISLKIEKGSVRTIGLTEYEARIYQALGMHREAIAKYENILSSSGYSVSSAEQYFNCRLKYVVEKANISGRAPLDQLQEAGLENIESEFQSIITKLEALTLIQNSEKRSMLLASAWKRKSAFTTGAGMQQAIGKAAEYYGIAAQFSGYQNLCPLTNWIIMEVVTTIQKHTTFSDTELKMYRGYLDRALKQSADINSSDQFRQHMEVTDAALCHWLINAVVKGRKRMPPVEIVIRQYQQVWSILGSAGEKETELEQLDIIIHAIEHSSNKEPHFSLAPVRRLKDVLQKFIH